MAKRIIKVDKDEFYDVMNMYCRGEVTMEEAGKRLGFSRWTFRNYLRKVLLGEPFDERIFKK